MKTHQVIWFQHITYKCSGRIILNRWITFPPKLWIIKQKMQDEAGDIFLWVIGQRVAEVLKTIQMFAISPGYPP